MSKTMRKFNSQESNVEDMSLNKILYCMEIVYFRQPHSPDLHLILQFCEARISTSTGNLLCLGKF